MNLKIDEYGIGNAPAIVLLHGLGVSSWMWHDQMEALRENFHILAIDLPGNGDSYEVEWESFGKTAVLLADIIRHHAANRQAHVVGLSLGGYAALHLLEAHSDVVLSMIVSGVSIRPLVRPSFVKPLATLCGARLAH